MKIVFLSAYPINKVDNIVFKKNADTKNIHPATWIVSLSKALVDYTDIELHIITLSNLIPRTQRIENSGINFHIIKQQRHGNLIPLNLNIIQILSELKKIKPDLINAFGTENPYPLAGVLSCYPCIITLQCIVSDIYRASLSLRGFIYKFLERYVIKCGKYFICDTLYFARFVRSVNSNAQIFNIYYPVKSLFFEGPYKEDKNSYSNKSVLFVAQKVVKRKGIEDLLFAFKIVNDAIPESKLRIIGAVDDHYFKSKLFKIITSNDLENNVTFVGTLDSEGVKKEISKAAVYVLPTHAENLGGNVEAMAMGTPIVTTNVGGIPYVLKDGETAFLVEPKDIESLANRIIKLLRSPELRKKMGNAARKGAIKLFHPETIAMKLYETYKSVLEMNNSKIK